MIGIYIIRNAALERAIKRFLKDHPEFNKRNY